MNNKRQEIHWILYYKVKGKRTLFIDPLKTNFFKEEAISLRITDVQPNITISQNRLKENDKQFRTTLTNTS